MGVNTNIMALNAQNQLSSSQSEMKGAMERLSSGLRINSAADDAAGLAISERLTSQINGLNQATRNANDGISIAQTAEGAMQESTNILQRMRELSIQSANGSNSSSDRAALQKEVSALQDELTRIADTTAFGTQKLLDGTFGSQALQVGAEANQTIDISLRNVSASSIGGQRIDGEGTTAGTTVAGATNDITAGTVTITNSSSLQVANVDLAAADEANDIASAINAVSSDTGVNATAYTEVEIASDYAEAIDAGSISTDQGTTDLVGVSSAQELVDTINADSSNTGLSASIDAESGNVRVASSEGLDISTSSFSYATAGSTATTVDSVVNGTADTTNLTTVGAATTTMGTVQLDSTDSFTATGGPTAEVFSGTASTLNAVDNVDIGTADGAQSAISVIDGALASINSSRADLGAIQNRLDSTISNLNNISENATAARSQIQDADFAQETSNLSRSQILQQAGTAMLSQANAAQQNVLSLLG
ncbi:flagellin N-terminal helical domain-containing protein [Guyparkeria halopsychrophila]|uniref:flagellin N-terminal helical domain-containing protein n=1 Tax=Guyparkeria halopsychrophila TaxID=3139421 RepID=UPI0037CAC8BB